MTTPAIEAVGITKHFDGVLALEGCSVSVETGHIHALLGENGAGKSTLIKILTGVLSADGGAVIVNGKEQHFHDTPDAYAAGVAALYQELAIVGSVSVAENIFLGQKVPSKFGLVNRQRLHRSAKLQLAELHLNNVSPRALGSSLSPIQQTMVALARALSRKARVLILDEPTASLTDTEVAELFTVLRRLRAEGVAILYVSHRLEEVFELCDRATIMRNGSVVRTDDVDNLTMEQVIAAMIGRKEGQQFPRRAKSSGEVILEVRGLSGRSLRDVSLTARAGEVLGIGGLAGSGRSELLRILAGAQRRGGGDIVVKARPQRLASVAAALSSGIALVPEERRSQGLVPHQSIERNIALANIRSISPVRGIVSNRLRAKLATTGMQDLHIRAAGIKQPVERLSGGNQQKVVLAKLLARRPEVLLLDEPTRGIDVGTKSEIYGLIRKLADSGTAVVLVSSELPELIGMSDRIVALREGRSVGEIAAEHADEEQLLSYFYGRTVA